MSIAQQISFIVEQLPETEQTLILELVRRISPDDILTATDLTDIEEARLEFARGESVPESAINWD
jgi:hypothetical protein